MTQARKLTRRGVLGLIGGTGAAALLAACGQAAAPTAAPAKTEAKPAEPVRSAFAPLVDAQPLNAIQKSAKESRHTALIRRTPAG